MEVRATIIDEWGEIDYPYVDATLIAAEGGFVYAGYRVYGGIIEHIWKFD